MSSDISLLTWEPFAARKLAQLVAHQEVCARNQLTRPGNFGLVILLVGCAFFNPSKVMRSWVGSHYSQLMLNWGPPTRSSPDGLGGQILVYEFDRNFGQIPGRAERQPDGSVTYTAPESVSWVAKRMFWVNSQGIIYAWRWQGL